MNCDKFNRLISLYLDGRLDEAEQKALREHLSRCPRCAETLAALESAEKTLRSAPVSEPGASYWNTFSRRVMEKIEARETEPQGLKRLAAILFPPSSRRLRIAAGVASLAIVVAVGVLYVERRGEGMIPPEPRPTVEKREAPATPKYAAEAEADAGKQGGEPSPEEKGATPEKTEADKLQTKKDAELPEVAEKKEAPTTSKPAEVAENKEAPPPLEPAEAPPAANEGAGADKPTETRGALEEAADVAGVEKAQEPSALQKTRETETRVPERSGRSRAESFTIVENAARRPRPAVLGLSDEVALQEIADEDTSITNDELRGIIEAWKAHIESHPTDSLTTAGYRQVAKGYALLAGRTHDDTVMTEGAEVIRTYLERADEPDLKAFLTTKLHEIEALRKK